MLSAPVLVVVQEVGWYDEETNNSGVLTSKLSSDAMAVKGQFGDTMGLLTQVGECKKQVAPCMRLAGSLASRADHPPECGTSPRTTPFHAVPAARCTALH